MNTPNTPPPDEIRLAKNGETLAVRYGDMLFPMSAEYLRVCSPSAEVRGHGGEWNTVGGKKEVVIRDIEPIGNYAIRLIFSDGHHTGIYSWDVLHDLAKNEKTYWQHYLQSLKANNKTREE